ncbi:hypothetical protein JRYRANMO_CDS_0053 [Salmonella phage FM4b]|uniref:Uncharacterized protein n=4 Tax=Caudoviricetes TaxID=2731619 RepID=A0A7S9SPR5_9CAUD|nr:hypothetical protein PQD19_gp129 [Salmonella phage vB_SAg-RPN213]QPI14100.1 hypothetical protein GECvBB1_gp060c [Salmonella phage GEC_vB_B1]QPI14248.1 hypothetical protein GECvBBS_gp060c [Salmonella phage GEC_vB_BS]QPI15694.1 hypothetical protein GECvBNS7_gp060c [Salmonella phage GEC_vB_NS7]WVH07059.1 hypothetical protein IKARNLZQ_CDS_0051 [Salmonella phage FG1m]WVH07202.1 hypothetical protein JRYRANMO_CDS_0053 [Salmonella phage FM4b]
MRYRPPPYRKTRLGRLSNLLTNWSRRQDSNPHTPLTRLTAV